VPELRYQINPDISLTVDLLGYLYCEPHWVGERHSHTFWELIVASSGDDTYEVELFSPREVHALSNTSTRGKQLLYIGFDFKYDGSTTAETVKSALIAAFRRESNGVLYSIFLKRIADGEEALRDPGLYTQIITFLLDTLDVHMYKITDAAHETALASEIKKYVNANLDKKISIRQISQSLYLSPKYIGQLFRRETGVGILQYAKRKKMEKALLLLKTEQFSITQISAMLGFENVSFFSATFKSYYGSSPAEFVRTPRRTEA